MPCISPAMQNPDGGFPGREGDSDLYYTGFALRGLAVLDALTPEICDRAAGFLRGCLTRQASVVDFFSFLYACVLVQAASGADVLADSPRRLARPRRRHAGDLSHDGRRLQQVARRGVGQHLPHVPRRPVLSNCSARSLPRAGRGGALRRCRAGARTAASSRSPPCAAAAPTRPRPPSACCNCIQGRELPAERHGAGHRVSWPRCRRWRAAYGPTTACRWRICSRRSPAAGRWRSSARWTASTPPGVSLRAVAGAPEGGFRGGIWDEATDVEYTFYGIGSLALSCNLE